METIIYNYEKGLKATAKNLFLLSPVEDQVKVLNHYWFKKSNDFYFFLLS